MIQMQILDSMLRRTSLVVCLKLILSTHAGAEAIEAAMGFSNTAVVSTAYEPKAITDLDFIFRYNKNLIGRWSVIGSYQTNLSSIFSGFHGGIGFDSHDLRKESLQENLERKPVIISVPKWLFRGSLSLGAFRYSDTLKSTNAQLGSRNRVGVQADLYGFNLSGSCYRFFSDRWAAFATLSQTIVSADNFGVTSTALYFGAYWYYQ
jgi:hypothetical protein